MTPISTSMISTSSSPLALTSRPCKKNVARYQRQPPPSWRRRCDLFLAATVAAVACHHPPHPRTCQALFIAPFSSSSSSSLTKRRTTSLSYYYETESIANVGGTLPEIIIELAEAEAEADHPNRSTTGRSEGLQKNGGPDYFWLDRLGDKSKRLVQRHYYQQQQQQQQQQQYQQEQQRTLARIREGQQSIPIVTTTTTTATTTQTPFSLLSWNILAQSLYDKSPSSKNNYFSWDTRLEWIVDTLVTADADVVCLQEVEQESFVTDLLPALQRHGYDGVVQGGPGVHEIKRRKGKHDRAHVVATFWNTQRFQPYTPWRRMTTTTAASHDDDDDDAACAHMARGRTLTSIFQDIRTSPTASETSTSTTTTKEEERNDNPDPAAVSLVRPTLAVMNCHLEGHPKQYAARIRQLQHTMEDLAKHCSTRNTSTSTRTKNSSASSSGMTLNGVVIAGDFNCELQSSACSTYLRIGRVGRKGGLGGVHGTSALAVPPSILESEEATEILHPILEWGHALPNDELETIPPHPLRRNSLQSAYPPVLGRADPTSHFTYCARPNRPVAGLDQIWYSGVSMTRVALRKLFPKSSTSSSDTRRKEVLRTGLPALLYPSDHLPIGAVFDWNACHVEECALEARTTATNKCTDAGVRELFVTQDQEPPTSQKPKSPILAYTELDFLLCIGPFDSEEQRLEIEFIVEQVPDLPAQKGQKPSEEQLQKLSALQDRKKKLLLSASDDSRQVLQRILKLNKEVAAYELLLREEEEADEEEDTTSDEGIASANFE